MTAEYKNLVELNPSLKSESILNTQLNDLNTKFKNGIKLGAGGNFDDMLNIFEKKLDTQRQITAIDKQYDFDSCKIDFDLQNDTFLNDQLCNFFAQYNTQINTQQTA